MEDAFRKMDSSGRGQLEESDLARALRRLDIEMSPQALRELLNHLDANGDGVVDAGEFLDAMRFHEEQMQATPDRQSRVGDTPARSFTPARGLPEGYGGDRIKRTPPEGVRLPNRHARGTPLEPGNGGGSLLSPAAVQAATTNSPRPKWRR